MKKTAVSRALALSLMAFAAVQSALAHTGSDHPKSRTKTPVSAEEHPFGRQGDPKKVTRTIVIDMTDDMRFSPSEITVKQGETVRFVVANKGKMLHEMVLGTMDELKAHGELMKKFPGMEHDEPYMTHVRAGRKDRMVWQFTQPGEFYFACLIPGHFEAGMFGKITVTKT